MAVCSSYWLCDGVMSRTACYISADDELMKALAVRANIYNVGIVDVIRFVQYAQKHNKAIKSNGYKVGDSGGTIIRAQEYSNNHAKRITTSNKVRGNLEPLVKSLTYEQEQL